MLETRSISDLDEEVKRARTKFPSNRHLLAALTEELGELAQAFLQKQGQDRIRAEALQVACVAMRIYEEGDGAFDDLSDADAFGAKHIDNLTLDEVQCISDWQDAISELMTLAAKRAHA